MLVSVKDHTQNYVTFLRHQNKLINEFSTTHGFTILSGHFKPNIISNMPQYPLLKSIRYFALLVLFPICAVAQDYPEFSIPEPLTSQQIRFLASDELLGRMTGEQGNRVAARYIAEHFRMYGLMEPSGAPDYMQKVPLYRQFVSEGSFLVNNTDTLFHRQDIVPISGDVASITGNMIYLEYIIDENGLPNAVLETKELTEYIVVTKFGITGRTANITQMMAHSAQKRELIKNSGASALIELFDGPFSFGGLANFLLQDRFIQGHKEDQIVHPHLILNNTEHKQSHEDFNSQIEIHLKGIRYEDIVTHNVAGIVEGTDPGLRDEFIVLMAHYDHIGAGMRTGITPADTIFNGARDNGMGVVGLLTAAKSLSEVPPKRSVLILAVTAEEIGLIGSAYYVQNPLIPLINTKFVMNVDSGGYNDTSIVTLIGAGRTTADETIAQSLEAFGLSLLPDPSPEQNLFNRSDNVNFARAGIPAPTFSPGFTAFDEELLKYYHRPTDKADESFDFAYLNVFARSYAYTARNLANGATTPTWTSGDPYEEAYQRLIENEQ
jgi:hypothetical protein